MSDKNVYFASLGCPKNLVDSEVMLGRLVEAGWKIARDEREADCIVVNTCSFIQSAVEESIDTILEMARLKEAGNCKRLVVVGCFPQRYKDTLLKELPEVDLFLGTGAFDQIVEAVKGESSVPRIILPSPANMSHRADSASRVCTTPPHTAYLKIADGCSNRCTYCIIPRLRGPYRSRPMSDILDEARRLVGAGVGELILVAQETTAYGMDLHDNINLAVLLEELAQIPGLVWVRFLYGHPDRIDDDLIDTVARHDNICNYFDIPVQHISEIVLKKMGRPHSSKKVLDLFGRIRTRIPDAALRTTLIVGFPGETEEDFARLVDFVEQVRFNHLGVFAYSNEDDLPAAALRDHVPDAIKEERRGLLMSRQTVISRKRNQEYVGKTLKVLVEGYSRETELLLQGRTSFQAPDIDGVVYISKGTANQGEWAGVRIAEAFEYDLVGEIV
jgi:ribosomal protein S12 methylthiotransferase